jgi:hypothetical protein
LSFALVVARKCPDPYVGQWMRLSCDQSCGQASRSDQGGGVVNLGRLSTITSNRHMCRLPAM